MNIFISHSSRDKEYGEALVQLLQDIGISQRDIIFTSKAGYGIGKGKNIFKWLKDRLQKKPFVIYLLSNNYYLSIPCLNEMGAAWVIENEHISLFVPGFDTNNSKFWKGAIDPRDLGVFIDRKEDMIEFVELIINKNNLATSLSIIDQAISKYMHFIDNIIIAEEPDSTCLNINNQQSKEITTNSHVENTPYVDNVNIKQEELVDLHQTNSIINITFAQDILKGKLKDEELLLIKYMSETGKNTLGDRWMADGEITNIRRWQDINELDSTLSNKYSEVLSKFKIRKYVIVNDTTSYGNPKEYVLIEDISNSILNLPESITKILDEAVQKHLKPQKSNIDSHGITF